MPTYTWNCACGYEHDELNQMIGPRIKACPKCKKMSFVRLIGCGSGVTFSSGYNDLRGDKVYFKEPYFDTALRRNFKSAREKAEFMNKHGIVSSGDSDIKAKREKKEYQEMKMDTKKEK